MTSPINSPISPARNCSQYVTISFFTCTALSGAVSLVSLTVLLANFASENNHTKFDSTATILKQEGLEALWKMVKWSGAAAGISLLGGIFTRLSQWACNSENDSSRIPL